MKLLDMIDVMDKYTLVRITPPWDIDWNDENPSYLGLAESVTYSFIKAVGKRDIQEVAISSVIKNDELEACISIVYSTV